MPTFVQFTVAETGKQAFVNLEDISFVTPDSNYDPRAPRVIVNFNSGKHVILRTLFEDIVKEISKLNPPK